MLAKHQDAIKDADLLITSEYGENLRKALNLLPGTRKFKPLPQMLTLVRNDCAMEINIMIATEDFDPEESCIHDTINLFLESDGFNLKLAKLEYLAWMLEVISKSNSDKSLYKQAESLKDNFLHSNHI